MTTETWHSYTLPRDKDESNRLELQHKIYTTNTTYLLHPRIVHSLPQEASIADVGTGTGIWLRDLIAESPSSWTFTGFDLSEDQFPKDHSDKVTYEKLDILDEVPTKYKGQFDVVHLRLLLAGMQQWDWSVAATNVFHMLKPGGWIQWHESDSTNTMPVQNVAGASRKACGDLLKLVFETLQRQGKYMPNDIVQLVDCVREAGFQDCGEDVIASDRVPEARTEGTNLQHSAVVGLAKTLAKHDETFALTSEQLGECFQRCDQELQDGKIYYTWNMHITTGRKLKS